MKKKRKEGRKEEREKEKERTDLIELRRQTQEDLQCEASMGCISRPVSKGTGSETILNYLNF
jgi:hypothetical protein